MAEDGAAVDLGADVLPQHLLNRANQELTGQIVHYEKESEKLELEVDDHKDRLKFMLDHLGNVKAEIANTQSLFEAKRREIQGEDHLAQLAERERGRLQQDNVRLVALQEELQERVDATQNRIFQGNLRMDEFKAAMNFNQEELEQWDMARKQKEDDAQVLSRYSKADEAKIKDLDLLIEKMQRQVHQKKAELEVEITETRSSQIELDKTAEDYKELHRERQYLLQQWEDAVKAMHRRDNAIKQAGDRYTEGKKWVQKRQKQLKSRAEFFQVETQNNREVGSKITQEERALAKYREDYAQLGKKLVELDDELEVVRNTLSKAMTDKSHYAAAKANKMQNLQEKQEQFQRKQQSYEAVMARMQDELEAASDLERQNKLVSDLFTQTEQSMKALDKEMTRIKDEQYHNSQALFKVRREQSNFLAEISGAQAQGRNMSAKISQLDAESFKQQELLYNIEFQVQQMERKVNRAKGERTEEEKRELQEKIEMLQKMYDDLLKQHKVLNQQVKRVGDDVRQAKHDTVRLDKEKKSVTEQLLELTLENESCQLELQNMTKQKEEGLVQSDILKLEVERLKNLLSNRDEELLGLENRKQQLGVTVSERELEIKVHHDVLRMEAKTAEQERRSVINELKARQKQVEHLKNHYRVLIGRMDMSEGETTHAQHIVRTAKEREELQSKGDALDGEIKRVEGELKKLDKTAAMLQGSNTKFKHQFAKVGENDDEVQQQKLLQAKNKEVQSIVNRRANELKDFLRTEMSKMSELQDRAQDRDEFNNKIKVLTEAMGTLVKDIEEQRELVARYDVAINKVRRQTEAEITQDILLLEDREKIESVTTLLSQVASDKGEELDQAVSSALLRGGIDVPADGPRAEE